MYEAFYGLTEKPFSILPDPDYLYWGKGHALAFAMLEYGVMNHAGFTVITGEIGCGKTTLIRHLLNRMDEDTTVGLVSNAQENKGKLLHWVLMAFGQPFEDAPYVMLYDQLNTYLIDQYANNRRTILIIDEAQNLGSESLEELRMLSNINADKDQLLQLILVGQPQLKSLLQRPDLVQFSQRIASDFHLNPLTEEDIAAYIKHRVAMAGGDKVLFTDAAISVIFEASRGIPRLVNILCDTSLVYGYSSEVDIIDEDIVQDVVRDKSEHGIFSFNMVNAKTDPSAPVPIKEKPVLVVPEEQSSDDIRNTGYTSGAGDAGGAGNSDTIPALDDHDKDLARYIMSMSVNKTG